MTSENQESTSHLTKIPNIWTQQSVILDLSLDPLLCVAKAEILSMWPGEKNQSDQTREPEEQRPAPSPGADPIYFNKDCFSSNVREELDVITVCASRLPGERRNS